MAVDQALPNRACPYVSGYDATSEEGAAGGSVSFLTEDSYSPGATATETPTTTSWTFRVNEAVALNGNVYAATDPAAPGSPSERTALVSFCILYGVRDNAGLVSFKEVCQSFNSVNVL